MARKKKISLTMRDEIALAGVAILGKSYIDEAFKMARNIKTENPDSIAKMRSSWFCAPLAVEFMRNIKKQFADVVLENIDGEGEGLSEAQLIRLIERSIVGETDMKKKGDLSLKLMQWKRDASIDSEGKEVRHFFLPWVSHCKTCELMKLYLNVQNELKSKEPPKIE